MMEKLCHQPHDAVTFTLNTLNDPQAAWDLAHDLCLDSDYAWADLANAYGKIDPLAVLPIHERLVRNELADAGAEHYRRAAKRLAAMRKLAPTPDSAAMGRRPDLRPPRGTQASAAAPAGVHPGRAPLTWADRDHR
ncbi:MAG TPA: hypothetical protein VGN54_10705 [Mycobacteriales bacterium]|nr:hypothetical protein [Mycobacteriales bacterium]